MVAENLVDIWINISIAVIIIFLIASVVFLIFARTFLWFLNCPSSAEILKKISHSSAEKIPYVNDDFPVSLNTNHHSFVHFEAIQNDRYLAISFGRILRIFDTSLTKYVLNYLHTKKILRIAELNKEKNQLGLLTYRKVYDEKEKEFRDCLFIEVLQLPFGPFSPHKPYQTCRLLFTTSIHYHSELYFGSSVFFFKCYEKRYFELATAYEDPCYFIIFDLKRGVTRYVDLGEGKDCPDKVIKPDQNLLIKTVGNRVTKYNHFRGKDFFQNFGGARQNFRNGDKITLDGGDIFSIKLFNPSLGICSALYPLKAHEKMFNRGFWFPQTPDSRFDFVTPYKHLTLNIEAGNIGQVFRKVEDFEEPIDNSNKPISSLKIHNEEHNCLISFLTSEGDIFVVDYRTMRVLEKFSFIDQISYSTLGLDFYIKSNKIYFFKMNFSDIYVLNSSVLCNIEHLNNRILNFYENFVVNEKTQNIVKHFTEIYNYKNDLIVKLPTSFIMIDLKNYEKIKTVSNTERINLEDRNIKSLNKLKLIKILLGYCVNLTVHEKFVFFLLFRELKMHKRIYTLLRKIEKEDEYNSSNLKRLFLLIYSKCERDWYFGVKKKFRPKKMHKNVFFKTVLTQKLFLMLWKLEEYSFLKNTCLYQEKYLKTEEVQISVFMQRWSQKIRMIRKNITKHPDLLYETIRSSRNENRRKSFFSKLSETDLYCSIDNFRELNENNEYFKNFEISSKENKKKFKVHFEVLFCKSILFFELFLKNNMNFRSSRRRRKRHPTCVVFDEIYCDEDLEFILKSIYERDIRPNHISSKYPDISIRGMIEGNYKEFKSKARVLQLADKYGDSDLHVDYQQYKLIYWNSKTTGACSKKCRENIIREVYGEEIVKPLKDDFEYFTQSIKSNEGAQNYIRSLAGSRKDYFYFDKEMRLEALEFNSIFKFGDGCLGKNGDFEKVLEEMRVNGDIKKALNKEEEEDDKERESDDEDVTDAEEEIGEDEFGSSSSSSVSSGSDINSELLNTTDSSESVD